MNDLTKDSNLNRGDEKRQSLTFQNNGTFLQLSNNTLIFQKNWTIVYWWESTVFRDSFQFSLSGRLHFNSHWVEPKQYHFIAFTYWYSQFERVAGEG